MMRPVDVCVRVDPILQLTMRSLTLAAQSADDIEHDNHEAVD